MPHCLIIACSWLVACYCGFSDCHGEWSAPPAERAVKLAATNEDTVYVSVGDSADTLSYRGEIVSYVGGKLVLRLANGTERTFASNDRVLRIDTQHTSEYREALALYESGEFDKALQGFGNAFELESRTWVQRLILERVIYCRQNLGQLDVAGQRFLQLVSSDPNTPYFSSIPLAWVSDPPSAPLERQAMSWLNSPQPIARLLGASHLLSTRRAEAEQALSDLRFDADQRVAALARMQLWRTDLHRVNEDMIDRWVQEMERFPHSLLAGGYFLIGSANAEINRAEDAALKLMRVPIHYPQQRRLGARCLIEAARQLEALGQTAGATRLYNELLDEFAAFPESQEAKERLDEIGGGDAP
ncbi:MAG: hypothetical protein MPJ50_08885 [Pirellulales bacterium]|nr:hypothetical protein [Pirellulales bacterium]